MYTHFWFIWFHVWVHSVDTGPFGTRPQTAMVRWPAQGGTGWLPCTSDWSEVVNSNLSPHLHTFSMLSGVYWLGLSLSLFLVLSLSFSFSPGCSIAKRSVGNVKAHDEDVLEDNQRISYILLKNGSIKEYMNQLWGVMKCSSVSSSTQHNKTTFSSPRLNREEEWAHHYTGPDPNSER